jgi:hypothetical protein
LQRAHLTLELIDPARIIHEEGGGEDVTVKVEAQLADNYCALSDSCPYGTVLSLQERKPTFDSATHVLSQFRLGIG